MPRNADLIPLPGLSASTDSVIVTGGDAAYFPMIEELHQSILDAASGEAVTFAVIDAGLTRPQVTSLQKRGAIIAQPPNDPAFPWAAVRKIPHAAVDLAKPWLDKIFPGFETLIFLDADTWVQDFAAVRMLRGAALTGALAIVPGGGRYWERQTEVRWLLGGIGGLCQVRSYLFKNGRRAGLPLRLLRDLGNRALLNAGVFALRADAPHWQSMRKWQEFILAHGGKPFTSDGVAMGLAIYKDKLPCELLPATCNYIRPWRIDARAGAVVEFYYPYPKVGIVHLAGQKHMRFDPSATTEVLDLQNRPHQLSLRYGQFQTMARALIHEPAHA
jgi:hypothetical protein